MRWDQRVSAWYALPFVAVVQSLSHIWLFATPWTAACQTSLSFTVSHSLLKPMPIESVMPPSHLILCHPLSSCPQSYPASGSFPMVQLFASDGQSTGASASTSVLPMNIQGWFPLGVTSLISLLSEVLSPPGSSIHGISQARILKWVAISFSRGYSWLRDQTHVSCIGRWILYHWAT